MPSGPVINVLSGKSSSLTGGSYANYYGTDPSGYGGAVYVHVGGTLDTSNTDFSANSVDHYSPGDGGAIANYGSMNISGGSFVSNQAGTIGGAIWNSGTATITDAIFNGNSAGYGGGAFHNETSATIFGGSFSGNHATNLGGAFYNGGLGSAEATISGVDFFSNTASYGGAIYNEGTIAITSGSFNGNSANYNGGAIWTSGSATISGGTFTGNTAVNSGGAICINATGSATITSASFSANYANCGGALFNENSAFISNATFNGNSAYYGGGAVQNNKFVEISNATFNGNSTIFGKGGAVFNFSATAHISSATFTSNTAIDGGAIFNSKSVVDVSDATFAGNTASYGGAIENLKSATITSANFNGNSASMGGAIYNTNSVTITSANFTGNTAALYGGAIYNTSSATITSASFNGNSATSGGAIDNRSIVSISGGEFNANTANYGGAICTTGSMGITSASFTGNTASNGGAIYNYGSATISSGEFNGNSAQGWGGAIYNFGSATISGGEFNANTANYGGAICTTDSMGITSASFNGNSAQDWGGAIYNYGDATISGGEFNANTAQYGGAICTTDSMGITSASFNGNSAQYGGAIYNYGDATISGGEFNANTAQYGGAIGNESTIAITSASFNGNSAQYWGGAIDNFGSATISGGEFNANTTNYGGAICTTGSMGITSASFNGNSAQDWGGAIYNYGDTTISDATFIGNSAASLGGAIYNCSDATISRVIFSGNAAQNGGAIANDGVMTVLGTNILKTATDTILNTSSAILFIGTNGAETAILGSGAVINQGTILTYGTKVSISMLTNEHYLNLYATKNDIGALTGSGSVYVEANALLQAGTGTHYDGEICNYGTLTTNGNDIYLSLIENGGTLQLSGQTTLGGDVQNHGTIVFDADAVITMTNSAQLNNLGAAQNYSEQIVWERANIMSSNGTTVTETLMTGDWNLTNSTQFSIRTSDDKVVSATLGQSFTDELGRELWLGSYNGYTGVTNNIVVNANTQSTKEDYANFGSTDALASTYKGYSGTLTITGGTFTNHLYTRYSDVVFQAGTTSTLTEKFVFTGAANENTRDRSKVCTINGIVNAQGLFMGDHYLKEGYSGGNVETGNNDVDVNLTINATAASSRIQFVSGGDLVNATSKRFTYTYGEVKMSVQADITTSMLTGGSIVGGDGSVVTEKGTINMKLTDGDHRYVAGAGYVMSANAALMHEGDINITIGGGSYYAIYGGIATAEGSYSRNIVKGDINITLDASKNDISLKYLFAGNGGAGSETLQGNTTVTVSGLGENLDFAATDGGVNGGNAIKTRYTQAYDGKVRTLAFNAFSGDFKAPYIESFDAITLTDGSKVTFTSDKLEVAEVSSWSFDDGTSLAWNDGVNSFEGDTLSFGTTASDADWTVIAGGDDCLYDGIKSADSVRLYGMKAAWSEELGAWTTDTHKLAVSGTNLVVSKLA